MFEELADYRAFELLRSHSARSDYLLTKQVKEDAEALGGGKGGGDFFCSALGFGGLN